MWEEGDYDNKQEERIMFGLKTNDEAVYIVCSYIR